MEFELINDKTERKYKINVEEQTAYIKYSISENEISLTHTIVPKELGGRGIGSKLIKLVLADIDKLGLKVIPVCSFVEHYLKKQF